MDNILITGGAGFIGANFVRHVRSNYPAANIVVLDLLTYAGSKANIEDVERITFVKGNICDQDLVCSLLHKYSIDTIVHFAAESHVDRSISAPDQFIDTNILGTYSLLKAAKEKWLDGTGEQEHRFHHVSTDEVFGSLGPHDPAFSETTPYAPNSPYSASKASSDHLVRSYHHTFGLQITTTNCSNNYGPYQFPEKLIPLFVINALHGRKLPIYGDGQNVRDWLYVEDHCRAIDLVLNKGQVGETYNVGGGEELPNLTVVEEICSGVDAIFAGNPELNQRFPDAPPARGGKCDSLKVYVEDRLGHDRRYAIDERKIHSELGYSPVNDFRNGFRKTLAWYIDNEQWWRGLMQN
ncbi:dTDP-glucose 4,6-dehydratase [Parasphingorhabdus sp.]|uniref:dTDP-glucose 4,6-dehydratase n=1 Tax=Parasphingorhabdus sp. TaxID=2709688 RepID=UPI003A935223